MFENTLLIIKPDYMHSRKCILLSLLSKGFQIQGNRKLAFSPEDAGEFMKELTDDKCYMFYVILLSKGTSEAFILTKENAVNDLIREMVCYFGNSADMESNVHMSKSVQAARREITFIFPNYVHEPLEIFDKHKFCSQPLLSPFISEVYNIMQESQTDNDDNDNWRTKIADWLLKTNAEYPSVSNQCSLRPAIGFQNRCQQTNPIPGLSLLGPKTGYSAGSSASGASSGLITSSSCVSCSSFERDDTCQVPPQELDAFDAKLKIRAMKTLKELAEEEQTGHVSDEHTEVINIYEYEDGEMLDETDEEFGKRVGVPKGDAGEWEVGEGIDEEALLDDLTMDKDEQFDDGGELEDGAAGEFGYETGIELATEPGESQVEPTEAPPAETVEPPQESAPAEEPPAEEVPPSEPAPEPPAEPQEEPKNEGADG